MNIEHVITSFIQNDALQRILKFECSDATCHEVVEMIAKHHKDIAYLLQEDSLYEQLEVKEYISFFAELFQHKKFVKDAMEQMHLQDIAYVKIKKLTSTQCVRVKLARCIVQDPRIYFLQEPLKDVDEETCRIILQWLETLAQSRKQVIVTSMSLKQLYLIDGPTYYLHKNEIQLLEHEEPASKDNIQLNFNEKISVKSNDKILLFHPSDIDYGESLEGKTYVHVRRDAFIYMGTLDELEAKMKRYGFYRCHRSYLVNMQKVSEIIKWTRNSYSLRIETLEDVKIPLSKGRIEELKELYHL